jgi:hypothetical protein
MLSLVRARQAVPPSSRLMQPHLRTHLSASLNLLDETRRPYLSCSLLSHLSPTYMCLNPSRTAVPRQLMPQLALFALYNRSTDRTPNRIHRTGHGDTQAFCLRPEPLLLVYPPHPVLEGCAPHKAETGFILCKRWKVSRLNANNVLTLHER